MPTGPREGKPSSRARRSQSFTVIVVSDRSQAVRKVTVTRRTLVRAASVAGFVALLLLALGVHYAILLRKGPTIVASFNTLVLEGENAHLKKQLATAQDRLSHIASTLDRVERYDTKLRAVSTLPAGGQGEAAEAVVEGAGKAKRPKRGSLSDELAAVEGHAARQESALEESGRYFEEQRTLLATAPAAWPTRGWVTSDFGTRLDPYTAERVMHRGLDIATAMGQPVRSPSDATVLFAGTESGYGKVLILDHGYGVNTRYGHLSQIHVKAGDKVKRGDTVAAVGNTGRSTGPHLHYEVRVNGVPENPRKFILE